MQTDALLLVSLSMIVSCSEATEPTLIQVGNGIGTSGKTDGNRESGVGGTTSSPESEAPSNSGGGTNEDANLGGADGVDGTTTSPGKRNAGGTSNAPDNSDAGGSKSAGSKSASGSKATGGSSSGKTADTGTTATGGAKAAGGSGSGNRGNTSSGATATGGRSGSGNTGISARGGTATGGKAVTGGPATGGKSATGSAATGGKAATGGPATGGAATGVTAAACSEGEKTLTSNGTGTHCGYAYEYWKDSGSGSLVLKADGFSVDWSNINNLLGRKGLRPGSKSNVVTYEANYQPNGNSYLCVYGWTKSPLIEYYIVDSWGTWRPPGGQGQNGTVSCDGATYDIYKTERVNQPSIEGTKTFYQFWSVRQQKRTTGTITVGCHFDAWASKGMSLGSLYEVSMTVEGYQSSGKADVKMSMK